MGKDPGKPDCLESLMIAVRNGDDAPPHTCVLGALSVVLAKAARTMGRLNGKWLLIARTTGDLSEDAFKLVEEELPPLGPNELCIKVIMVSCDPTQIGEANPVMLVVRRSLMRSPKAAGAREN